MEDVYGMEPAHDASDHALDILTLRDIRTDEESLSTHPPNHFCGFLPGLLADVRDCDTRTFSRECEGGGAPNS
jgi:hypothetical protein